MKFVKIIYFDESSVTDFLQIMNGGSMKTTENFITEVAGNGTAGAEAEAGIDTKAKGLPQIFSFLTGTKLSLDVKGNAEISKKQEHVVKNILENTILTDFLDMIEEKKEGTSSIKFFNNLFLFPEANSFSYLMMAAPYFSMIKGQMPLPDNSGNEFELDISKMADAIEQGRGYYEFIAKYRSKERIFRFNRTAFRNNYTMSDVTKMKLSVYAIKVGEVEKKDLDLNTEFQFGTQNKNRVEYGTEDANQVTKRLEVFDVLLAGIAE